MGKIVTLLGTFCFLFFTLLAIPDTEYYDLLGVKFTASDIEIKKAFRRVSVEKHPDRNKSPNAQEEYTRLVEAYDVLKDPDSRHMYDMYGKEGVSSAKQNAGGNNAGGGIFDDIINTFFGGGGGGGHQQHQAQKMSDVMFEMQVNLNELYQGASKKISYKRNVICHHCRGTGAEGGDTKQCPKCRGSGRILVEQQIMPGFRMQSESVCPKCHGKGQIYKKECNVCHGHGTHPQLTQLDVTIEKGMKDGDEIRFPRKAEERPGYVPGDIIVKLKQTTHSYYVREGDNLFTTVELTLTQALLGFDLNVEHLDGRWINMRHNDITSFGMQRKYPKEGMPIHNVPSQSGDLFITYDVTFPDTINEEQKKKLQNVFSGMSLKGQAL